MPAAPYLLHVKSRPTQVSDETWEKWYVDEHIPDLFNHKSCKRDSFYEEITTPSEESRKYPVPEEPRKYLALYHTDFEELLKSEEYKGIRNSSEVFKNGGSDSSLTQDNGDFDARYYKLWQEYDPKGVGEQPSPHIVCVYMNPSDEEDFERWYREEHLPMLSKLPGYRRSLRYKIGPRNDLTKGETQPYLAIHEIDDVQSAFGSEEAKAANETPWSKKHIGGSVPFIARPYRRISAAGY